MSLSLKDAPLLPPIGKHSKTTKKHNAYRFEVEIDISGKNNYTHINFAELVSNVIKEKKKNKEGKSGPVCFLLDN